MPGLSKTHETIDKAPKIHRLVSINDHQWHIADQCQCLPVPVPFPPLGRVPAGCPAANASQGLYPGRTAYGGIRGAAQNAAAL